MDFLILVDLAIATAFAAAMTSPRPASSSPRPLRTTSTSIIFSACRFQSSSCYYSCWCCTTSTDINFIVSMHSIAFAFLSTVLLRSRCEIFFVVGQTKKNAQKSWGLEKSAEVLKGYCHTSYSTYDLRHLSDI